MAKAHTAFIAYPAEPPIISDAVEAAVTLSNSTKLRMIPWKRLPIIGLRVDQLIRDRIAECDVLLADITYPNFNVYYEIGYAIALDKPIIPLVNTSVADATRNAQAIGLFDTIGWLTYANSREMIDKLSEWQGVGWTGKLIKAKNHASPLFILDTLVKSNYRNYIFSEVSNSQVQYRPFDPIENPRLTATHAIAEASSSAGAILMLLSDDMADAQRNNLRTAFLAGLAHGYGIEPLILQFDDGPAPLDYRDFVTNSASRTETERHVGNYCAEVLIRNQQGTGRGKRYALGLLSKIDLGASAAEVETQQLADYFIPTAEYARALRAEGALVIGRKGSGKTAIALRAMSESSRERGMLVLELRPADHNLSDLREQLLSKVGQGLFDHTIAAFWQYVLLLEALLCARERALKESKYRFDLQEQIRKVEEKFLLTQEFVSSDFTGRLEMIVASLLEALKENPTSDDVREHITNAMYEGQIAGLRDELLQFGRFYTGITVLLDDLDKNWPPRRLEKYDVRMLRHLIEVLKRMQRDLRRRDVDFKYLMFLRSDVYENLVEETSDRGKENVIQVDWSDREQLTHLLRERVISSFDGPEGEAAWEAFNAEMSDGRRAVDHMIEASLFRPRFLIEVAERVLSFAINRGHTFVLEDDVEQALNQMSLYLVSGFGYEMRNVAGTPEDIFYAFLGTSELLTHGEVTERIKIKWPDMDPEITIDLLAWYGFLGIVSSSNEPIFIFDRAYDFRRLMAERPSERDERLYAVNSAFTRGLKQPDVMAQPKASGSTSVPVASPLDLYPL